MLALPRGALGWSLVTGAQGDGRGALGRGQRVRVHKLRREPENRLLGTKLGLFSSPAVLAGRSPPCGCGKMEEYEKFCEKSLARIQKASLSTESFLPVQSEGISLIRFHGVAVLSPLLNIEKRKEMQQEKQKALDVEARKQVNRKKALLTRVQEILENVQVRKAPNAPDFDQWEAETVYSNSEVRNLNVPATFPNTLPSSTEHSTLAKFEKITGILPLNEDQFKSNGIDLTRDSEKFNFLKQGGSSDIGRTENEASLKTFSATPQETLISGGLLPKCEEQDPSLLEEVTPDPYLMSLQNLMKKSKEYIEREQSRRSLRSSAKEVLMRVIQTKKMMPLK
ncbi:hypothetical protein QTO34_013561 [Cnephaeus nilssonii]|uniref:Uncharacterized protein n=1 Tax=Cnephaeus nilssonii TaxID=3371016 RepID=A0AA40I893_CNENI|nr:hypothetical protein QTO34_013561 [Eptesicus nilssonii]